LLRLPLGPSPPGEFATGPDAVDPSPQTDAAFMAWLSR
jgi:hypothetical protein